MGWWSTSVLGGDQPLDVLNEIERLLDVKDLYPLESISTRKRKKVQKNWDWKKVADWLCGKPNEKGMYHIDHIDVQVLVCVGLACGVKFSNFHKSEFSTIIDKDPWAKEDENRKQSMDALKEALLSYEEGVPTFVDNLGVIETIMAKEAKKV